MTPGPSPRDEKTRTVLDRIDDAVTPRCGHCRTLLTGEEPSLYWCTPACQKQWSNMRATKPHDVYSRPDATSVDIFVDGFIRQQGVRLLRRGTESRVVIDRGVDHTDGNPTLPDGDHTGPLRRRGVPLAFDVQINDYWPREPACAEGARPSSFIMDETAHWHITFTPTSASTTRPFLARIVAAFSRFVARGVAAVKWW